MDGGAGGTQRVDKWLWYARFFKTRALATRVVLDGKVRITAGGTETTDRVTKAAQTVRAGDVLTFPQGPHIRVIKVVAPGVRRGPATEAAGLFEDLAPPQPRTAQPEDPARAEPAQRDPGAGRPTKRDRRALDRLRDDT